MWFPSLILHVKWLYFPPNVVQHVPVVVLLFGIINHFPLLTNVTNFSLQFAIATPKNISVICDMTLHGWMSNS